MRAARKAPSAPEPTIAEHEAVISNLTARLQRQRDAMTGTLGELRDARAALAKRLTKIETEMAGTLSRSDRALRLR